MEDGAGCKEEQPFVQHMIERVIHACGEAQCSIQAYSSQYITDLGNGTECKQPLEVMLGNGHCGAKEHGHTADQHQQSAEGSHIHRLEQEVAQTDDGINTALCQHAGNQNGDGCRCGTVCIRCQRVEGHYKRFGREAYQQQGKSYFDRRIHIAGDQRGKLCEVQRMRIGIQHDDTCQNAGGTHASDNQILECGFQSSVNSVPKSSQSHSCEGEDLHHDEHVENVPRQHQPENAACEHQEKGIVLRDIVVMRHILKRIQARYKNRRRNQKSEKQGKRIDFHSDTDGISACHGAVAHPVRDDLTVEQHRLYQGQHAGQGC